MGTYQVTVSLVKYFSLPLPLQTEQMILPDPAHRVQLNILILSHVDHCIDNLQFATSTRASMTSHMMMVVFFIILYFMSTPIALVTTALIH